MEERLSRTFDILRFPLAVWVVLIHSGWSEVVISGVTYGSGNLPIFRFLSHLICVALGGIVVPTFLFISGYLFFRSGTLSRDEYQRKIKRRMRSLVIPYFVWNVIVLLFSFIYQSILAQRGYVFGSVKPVFDYSIADFFHAFWDIKSGAPICFQLWYVRDLIILSILSPLIGFLLTSGKKVGCAVVLLIVYGVYVTYWPSFPPSWSSVLYFIMGGACSLYQFRIVDGFSSPITRVVLLYPLLFVALFLKGDISWLMASWPVGVLFLLNCVYLLPQTKIDLPSGLKKLAGISFFLYCIHEPLLTTLRKVTYLIIQPSSDLVFLCIWIGDAIVLVTFAVVLGLLIQTRANRLWAVLNGR